MQFSSKVLRCEQSPMRKFHPYAVAAAAAGLLHKQRGCIYSKSQDEYYAGKEARHGKIVYA